MSDVQHELRAFFDEGERAFARGATVEEIMTLMYDDDSVYVGEGDPAATRGLRDLVVKAGSLFAPLGARPRITFRIGAPVLASGTVAVAMLEAECLPDQPGAELLTYRMMTGLRRGARGWRVVLEMSAAGGL